MKKTKPIKLHIQTAGFQIDRANELEQAVSDFIEALVREEVRRSRTTEQTNITDPTLAQPLPD